MTSKMDNAYPSSISKESINQLPVISFVGNVQVVSNPEAVKIALGEIAKEKFLGFDTETRPAFKKGEKHQVALLQLSSRNKSWLFQLKKTGIPPELKALLEDAKIVKVGLAIRDDLKALQYYTKFTPTGFIDLQEYVKQVGIEDNGLQKIAAIVLNAKISKAQRVTNWENDPLTERQIAYAATDAWVCVEVFSILKNQL